MKRHASSSVEKLRHISLLMEGAATAMGKIFKKYGIPGHKARFISRCATLGEDDEEIQEIEKPIKKLIFGRLQLEDILMKQREDELKENGKWEEMSIQERMENTAKQHKGERLAIIWGTLITLQKQYERLEEQRKTILKQRDIVEEDDDN